MIMSAHCLWIWVINQHLCRFWLVHPQAQGWVVSAPYVHTPPRTSRLIWAWFSHSKGRSTRGPETQNVSWRLILGLLVHTFYRTKQGTKLAHVQKWADSSSLVRRAANDMAKRVDTGEDEGMGLPTQSTFYSNFPSNILNESAQQRPLDISVCVSSYIYCKIKQKLGQFQCSFMSCALSTLNNKHLL